MESEFGLNLLAEGGLLLRPSEAPDVLGAGFFPFSRSSFALSAARFLRSTFHYIRVRRGGAGRALGCEAAAQ